MQKQPVTIAVNPHDISFLKRRTGVSSRTGSLGCDTQKVVNDALALYKAIVALALEGERLGTFKDEGGKTVITALDLQSQRLDYAFRNSDIEDLTRQTVEASFQRFIEDQRRHAARVNDGGRREAAVADPLSR